MNPRRLLGIGSFMVALLLGVGATEAHAQDRWHRGDRVGNGRHAHQVHRHRGPDCCAPPRCAPPPRRSSPPRYHAPRPSSPRLYVQIGPRGARVGVAPAPRYHRSHRGRCHSGCR